MNYSFMHSFSIVFLCLFVVVENLESATLQNHQKMPVSLLLNLTENILTCESPIIQSLTIYSYEIKICPTQYSSEMAVILNGSEEPQVQDSGSGQHCHTYQCLLLQHWINHFSFFHAVVSSLTFTYSIYLHDKVYIYTTASPWIKYGLALFPLLPPVSACCGSHQEASQPNEQGRGYCVLHLISSCCWLKVQGGGTLSR